MKPLRDMMQAFWSVAIGLVVLYAFLVAMGALAPADSWAVTAIVGALIVLLAIHFERMRRAIDRHGPSDQRRKLNQLRERRGF